MDLRNIQRIGWQVKERERAEMTQGFEFNNPANGGPCTATGEVRVGGGGAQGCNKGRWRLTE